MVEKVKPIIMWAVIIILIVGIIFLLVTYMQKESSAKQEGDQAIMKAVVMEVYENALGVMEIKEGDKPGSLYIVSLAEEGNIGFTPKQEIRIYFDGIVAESYPAQIHHVSKIEILKDTTKISIPDDIVRYYQNSKDKVNIHITQLTTKGLTITIEDENELPYEYTNDYVIYQEVKNENYTGVGQKLGEDTENSTSGYTGTGAEYIWKELHKNTKVEETVEEIASNQTDNSTIISKRINWENLYGELPDGKYELIFSHMGTHPINIQFVITNKNAQVISQEFVGI